MPGIARRSAAAQGAQIAADIVDAWHVKSTDVSNQTRFRGTEDDARKHVVANYPRLHVQPGTEWGQEGPMPEVVLLSHDGKEEYWNGEKWITEDDQPVPSEPIAQAAAVQADVPAGSKAVWTGSEWVLVDNDGVPVETNVETDQTQEVGGVVSV